jgi:hypothetical protein
VEGASHGFADPAREVDVCRGDDDPLRISDPARDSTPATT